MSVLIKGITAKELLDVFEWARTGANNCMIGHGVIATELPDHGDLIDREALMPKGEEKGLRLMAIGIEKIVNAPTVIPAERNVDKDKDVPCKGAERSEE